MRAFVVVVDDCAKVHLYPSGKSGGQCIKINNQEFGMNFDRWKCYFRAQKPTHHNLNKYPIIEITSPLPYEPQHRYSRRLDTSKIDIEDWRARLGYPIYEVIKLIVHHTTHLINTLQSKTNEYMKDHYKTKVWALIPRCIDDIMFSDTLFSSVCSIRGFNFFKCLPLNGPNMKKLPLYVGSLRLQKYTRT